MLRPLFVVCTLLGTMAYAAEPQSSAAGQTTPSIDTDELMTRSPAEKSSYAVAAIEEMRGVQRTMTRIETTAPQCATSRLVMIDTLIDVSEVALAEMAKLLGEGQRGRADSEFRKVVRAQSAARTLLAAVSCNPDVGGAGGETGRTVVYSGLALSDADGSHPPPSFDFDASDSPPESSPFM